jgi:hypothetical protein
MGSGRKQPARTPSTAGCGEAGCQGDGTFAYLVCVCVLLGRRGWAAGLFDDVEDAHVWARFPALRVPTTNAGLVGFVGGGTVPTNCQRHCLTWTDTSTRRLMPWWRCRTVPVAGSGCDPPVVGGRVQHRLPLSRRGLGVVIWAGWA